MSDHDATTHTSVEKVNAFIEYQLTEMAGDAIGQGMVALARPMVKIPDDPDVLDVQLAGYAELALALRSDGAPPLQICDADGKPVVASE